jgi:quinolinate synthase
MLLWNGGCHVHERISVEKIIELKKQYPDAIVMAHLECKAPVFALADIKGSTADMLREAKNNAAKQFIVATEAGILHELQRTCPDKEFIPVPPEISESGLECSCNECQYMKLNTLEKVYECLKNESPQIEIDHEIAKEAVKPINRMLELS